MGSDRRTRLATAAAVLLLGTALAFQALTFDRCSTVEAVQSGPYPWNTLVGVHSYDDDGRIVEVSPEGEVVWEWSVPDSRVFAVEQLDEDTVLAAVAVKVPARECDEEYLDVDGSDDHCVPTGSSRSTRRGRSSGGSMTRTGR